MDKVKAIQILLHNNDHRLCGPKTRAAVDKAIAVLSGRCKNCNKWISVKERLPEKRHQRDTESVDVFLYSAFYKTTDIGHYDYHWKTFFADDYSRLGHVTHWMPLPEPPEGGAE